MTGKHALEIRSLSKGFQSGQEQLRILIDLDLDVQKGAMVAITGASGSGKSTLLQLVGGMEKPDAGQILFEGTDVTQLWRLTGTKLLASSFSFTICSPSSLLRRM